MNKYAAELIPERLRNGVLMVSGPHEVISALSEFSRRQRVECTNQELGGKVVTGVQFHPVRLACIKAYSQQLPKRVILFLWEPFKIERLGDRHYMQISDHLHYLVQHVGADGKFDHNEGAWPIAKDRGSRAVDVLNNYCDNLPSLPTVLANLSLDIANDLGKLVDRTRQRFVTSRAFGAGAVAVGALEQAVNLRGSENGSTRRNRHC